MKRAVLIVLSIGWTIGASAQTIAPEDAKRRLEERNAQRQQERGQMLQISAGELADLRGRIVQLEGQIKTFEQQLEKRAETPKKVYNMVEIGMTKDEVMALVKRKGWRIVGMQASAGISKRTSAERVSTTTDGSATETERQRTSVAATGKTERFEVVQASNYKVETGTTTNSLGQRRPTYGTEERVDGRMLVTLVDGVVTEVNAR